MNELSAVCKVTINVHPNIKWKEDLVGIFSEQKIGPFIFIVENIFHSYFGKRSHVQS